jgi:hypothetical protein
MPGRLSIFFREDHRRLGELLEQAAAEPSKIDPSTYSLFRAGLLRHISMEERVLIPALERSLGQLTAPMVSTIRLDHGALAALLVPPPSGQVVRALRAILAGHNALEEGPGGLYDLCDASTGEAAGSLLEQVREVPEVPVRPHNPDPGVLEVTRRALARAGYDWDAY